MTSLETAINQTRKKEREVANAKEAMEGLKEEGIGGNALILVELLKPIKSAIVWFREIISWKRPAATFVAITIISVIEYKEWVGKSISARLLVLVSKMIQARLERLKVKQKEITVCTASEPIGLSRENIVSAQHGFITTG
ncbi:uncharacterized protein LOC120144670 [Hibiscus syriacus]|uniref:uncharacterized protein LOC120144670 n=1 Tax=Hibiscus syriacus TaxID=106335 RepID=UPI00192238CD|nr:uncharacterized protein LOC120144670 [Hibiscus syriacus]